jgi:tetratricopeptide (TPR) repeat protein
MDREVLADPAVAGFANGNLVVYKVNAAKGEGPDLVGKHGVQGYPTFVLLDAAGEELDRQVGASKKEPFLAYLKDVRAGNHLAGLRAKAAKAPEDAVARAKLGVKLFQRGDDGAEDHLAKALALDPKDAHPETIEARFCFSILEAQATRSPDPIVEYAKKYEASPRAVDAHQILLNFARQTEDEEGQAVHLEFLVKRAPDANVRNELAWFLATRDRELDRALVLVDAALKEEPKTAAYVDTRAECLSRLGRHDEAVAEQERAVKLLPAGTPDEQRAEYEGRLDAFRKKRDEAKAKPKDPAPPK